MKPHNIWVSIAVIIMAFSTFGWCESKTPSSADNKSRKKKPVVIKESKARKSSKVSNKTTLKQLEQSVDLSDLRADMSFGSAVEVLRNSTKPSARIVVLWGQLEQINVRRASRVSMDGISEIPLRTGLKMLLTSVSNGQNDLDYWVTNGVIVIGTKDSKPKQNVTRPYNVRDLTSRPAEYYAPGAGINQWQAGRMGTGSYGQPFRQRGMGNFRQSGYGRFGGGGGYGGLGMYGGRGRYRGFGTRTMSLRTGSSLSVGAWGGRPRAGGTGNFGGYNRAGMGGMGFNTIDTQIRQQQLSGLIKNTIEPGTWNE